MIAFDCRFFDGAVHAFNLTVGPVVIDFGESVFNTQCLTDAIKGDEPITLSSSPCGKLNAIIGQNGVDFIRHDRREMGQKISGNQARGAGM